MLGVLQDFTMLCCCGFSVGLLAENILAGGRRSLHSVILR